MYTAIYKLSIHSFITNVKEENYGRSIRDVKEEIELEGKNSLYRIQERFRKNI